MSFARIHALTTPGIAMTFNSQNFPLRPAWIEIDLGRLRRNLKLIRRDLPPQVRLIEAEVGAA